VISPYSDGSAYDALVDDHCFPSCFDDGDDLGLTPADARRTHFQNVVAGLEIPGATASDPSPRSDPSPPTAGAGTETTNVSGARHAPGAA
jgi:hypothetical protein